MLLQRIAKIVRFICPVPRLFHSLQTRPASVYRFKSAANADAREEINKTKGVRDDALAATLF